MRKKINICIVSLKAAVVNVGLEYITLIVQESRLLTTAVFPVKMYVLSTALELVMRCLGYLICIN